MILIPEIETVVILVPRTGSGSLRRAIADAYPKSMMIYRHMEADGVPHGYDHWAKVGVVRDPIDRLWSLYKFLSTLSGNHRAGYITTQRASVARSFSDWLVNNQTVFTTPHGPTEPTFTPIYTTRHQLPENRKSQFVYLRPDLGTEIYPFAKLYNGSLTARLKLPRPPGAHIHRTETSPPPALTPEASEHIRTRFTWDTETNDQFVDTPTCQSARI